MSNEDWNIMMTLAALRDKSIALGIYMTDREFTGEQMLCLEMIIGRLTAIAVKRKPQEAAQ